MVQFLSFAVTFLLASVVMASPLDKRTFTGKATWSYQGLGACGITTTDDELVTGVDALYFDSYPGYHGTNPNKNPLCGKTITVKYNGKSVTVKVTDRNLGTGKYDLNLSPTAFNKLDNIDDGTIYGVKWVQN